MLALLVAATLAQSPAPAPAPSVGLFLRAGPGGLTPTLRESVLASVAAVLEEAGFPISVDAHDAGARLRQADAGPCSRGVECLYRVARVLDVAGVGGGGGPGLLGGGGGGAGGGG